MDIVNKIDILLLETTFLGNLETGIGDDGQPPDNVHMGLRYIRKEYNNRLTGYNSSWAVYDDEDWTWDWFYGCKSMEDPVNIHQTMKSLEKIYSKDRLLRYFKKKPVPAKQVDKLNVARNQPERDPINRLYNDPEVEVIVKVDPDPATTKTADLAKPSKPVTK